MLPAVSLDFSHFTRVVESEKMTDCCNPPTGIGLALSNFLLQKPQSAKLVVIARSKQPLEELKARYPNDQVQVLVGDLSDFSLGQQAVDLATSRWGKLDGMVLNHGVLGPVDRIANNDPKDWRSCFDVNLFSSIAFVRPYLIDSCETWR